MLEIDQVRHFIYCHEHVYMYISASVTRCVAPPWNDMDSCRSLKSRKKSIKLRILAFKVIEFGANRQLVYDFLLGLISHHY